MMVNHLLLISKMMNCKVSNIIFLSLIILLASGVSSGIDAPGLFNKDAKMDKLVLKNQIAFHFRKVVREVSQELFVSRKIDISSLFLGIQVLENTQISLGKFCESLASDPSSHSKTAEDSTTLAPVTTSKDPKVRDGSSNYTFVKYPMMATFPEAKARCEALGMQLPELYTKEQVIELTSFLKTIDIKMCFAGIMNDPLDAIGRFISTGFPIWRSAINEIIRQDTNKKIEMMDIMDDLHAKYLYSSSGTLLVSLDQPSTVERKKYASHTYRHANKDLAQTIGRIVCEKKWDGTTYNHYFTDGSGIPDLKVFNTYLHQRHKRAVMQHKADVFDDLYPKQRQAVMQYKANVYDNIYSGQQQAVMQSIASPTNLYLRHKRAVKPSKAKVIQKPEIDNLQELCQSIVSLAEESHKDASSKLTNLLSSVDISAHLESDFGRQKRVPIFLAKMVFTTGVKLIWNLFSFVQQTRADNRVKSLQKAVAATGDLAKNNNNAIKEMSEILYSQSIAIQKLTIKADDLDQRLSAVETKVGNLETRADKTEDKLEAALVLQQIENLILRVVQSHNNGFDTLEDIIHCSLLGQTSPQILPVKQMEKVQSEVRKVSTAMLDPDFSRMQSIIITDPTDAHFLLVVVNMAALDRRSLELVNLIPIPSFENDKAYIPVLDYSTIVLNQLSATFSILTPQEESNCLTDRCYVSSVERQTAERSCGIPQLYDRHLDACIYDDIASTGIFIQPVLPDGIIFSLKTEVDAQLFCKDNTDIRTPKKLRGTGVLQLPNGCTLSVTDQQGRSTKVKGQPVFRMIDTEDLELAANGPLSSTKTVMGRNRTHKLAAYEAMLSEHYSSVVRQVETVDVKISSHNNHIWGLTGSVLFVLLLTIIAFLVSYKYSRRFRKKIHSVRTGIHEITQQILHLQATLPLASIRRHMHPHLPPKPVGALMQELLSKRHRENEDLERQKSKSSSYINSRRNSGNYGFDRDDHVYQPASSFSRKRPLSQGIYPRVPDEPEDLNWRQSVASIRVERENCPPVHKSGTLRKK